MLKRKNRESEAEPIYKAAIEKAQQDAPTLVLIADSMQAEQQWVESEPVLRRALAAGRDESGCAVSAGPVSDGDPQVQPKPSRC